MLLFWVPISVDKSAAVSTEFVGSCVLESGVEILVDIALGAVCNRWWGDKSISFKPIICLRKSVTWLVHVLRIT